MVDVHLEGLDQATVDRQQAFLAKLSERFHGDADFRERLKAEAPTLLREMGMQVPPGVDVKVMANTPTLVHFVFPPDPNAELSDEALSVVAGGSSASTAGSAATISTLGCIPGTWSSAGTAGTAGSAGCG